MEAACAQGPCSSTRSATARSVQVPTRTFGPSSVQSATPTTPTRTPSTAGCPTSLRMVSRLCPLSHPYILAHLLGRCLPRQDLPCCQQACHIPVCRAGYEFLSVAGVEAPSSSKPSLICILTMTVFCRCKENVLSKEQFTQWSCGCWHSAGCWGLCLSHTSLSVREGTMQGQVPLAHS